MKNRPNWWIAGSFFGIRTSTLRFFSFLTAFEDFEGCSLGYQGFDAHAASVSEGVIQKGIERANTHTHTYSQSSQGETLTEIGAGTHPRTDDPFEALNAASKTDKQM